MSSLRHFVPDAYRQNIPVILEQANLLGWSDRMIAKLVLGDVKKYPTVWRWRTGEVVPSDPQLLADWLRVPVRDLLYADLRAYTLPRAPEVAGVKVNLTAPRRAARMPAPRAPVAPRPAHPVAPTSALDGPVWVRAGA